MNSHNQYKMQNNMNSQMQYNNEEVQSNNSTWWRNTGFKSQNPNTNQQAFKLGMSKMKSANM